jgi:Na+-translocating ferredoxin:NAD+ oxidoreductase RnfG subunit
MLTIHIFETDIDLQVAVEQKIKELTVRKKTDPVCNYKITESPDGKEFMVDFLLGENKDGQMTIVEFNVYRYKQIKLNKKKTAIIVYAFSKRSYGGDITVFFQALKDDRIKYLNEMISTDIPAITIENK